MSKISNNKLVPKIRFPEFVNEGEWEETTLENIAEIKRGAASQHLKYVEKNHPNAIRLLRINDFLSDTPVYIEDTDDIKRFRVKTNDLLIAGTGATAGITFIVPEEFNNLAYSYNAPRIRIDKVDCLFVYNYLKSDAILCQQKKLFVGNAQPFLDISAIGSFKLYIPKQSEQQKIASCLSSLDEIITTESQKLEMLKEHKKGLLQNLLPQIGKTVPKFRFKEFENSGEWVEKTLGEIGEFIGGGTPDTSVQEYWNGEIQWFTPTEIKEKNIKRSIRTITQKGLQNSSAKLLPKGALLITTRATIGDVGIAIEECTTNQGFQSLVVNNIENNLFWYYWLTQHKNELKRKSSGSTFPEIGKKEIIKIVAYSPKKTEQQKIASFLSSIDDLINTQSQKVETLKLHKKGLLQGLFPTIRNEE